MTPFDIEEIEILDDVLDKHNSKLLIRRQNTIDSFQKKLTLEKSEKLFETANEEGLFHRVSGGSYMIPIPSMHHWLVSGDWKVKVED